MSASITELPQWHFAQERMMNDEPMITITLKEYSQLLQDSKVLAALYSHGVDNWEWYDDAIGSVEEDD